MGTGISGVEAIMWTQLGRMPRKIQEYIQKQLQEDMINDQLTLNEYIDPFTGEPVKKTNK